MYMVFPIMFAERGGVSGAGVGFLLAFWQIVILVSEVPTGLIADRFGRKTAMLLGKILRVGTMPVWLLMPNFTGFLVGFILLGVGDALLSGSLEAYSYDELKDKSKYSKLRQQTVSIHLAAFSGAGLIAFLLDANYVLILLTSILFSVLGALFALYLPKDTLHTKEKITLKRLLQSAQSEIVPSKKAFLPFIRTSLVLSALIVFIEYITLFYKSTGVSTRTVALLSAVGNIVTFFLLWFAHIYEKWIKRNQNVALIALLTVLAVTVFAGLPASSQIVAVFVLVRIIRVANIHLGNELQHSVTARARATIGSLASFLAKIGAAVSMVVIGLFSANGDVRPAVTVTGGLLVLVLIATYLRRTSVRV